MKFLAIFLAFVTTLILIIYTLLFTSFGNGILKPIIEDKINSERNTSIEIETFELDMSHFNLKILLTPSNSITASGSYGIFSQSIDATYSLAFEKMRELAPLLQRPSKGNVHIKGSVIGDAQNMEILGESDIAASLTKYKINLEDFNPTQVIATINNAQLDKLLALTGEHTYARANISLDVKLLDANPKHLDGSAILSVNKGRIDTALMKKMFNLTLPKTQFGVKVVSKLKADTVSYVAKVQSNLLNVNSQGALILAPLRVNLNYDIDINELALLRPITKAPLRGEFATQGQVKGSEASLNILGSSDLAGSDTTYDVTLTHFKPQKVLAKISDAKLSKLLYMLGEDKYAQADIDMDVKLTDLDPKNLQGEAKLDVSKGTIFPATMKKSFGIVLPKTHFTTQAELNLNGKVVHYTLALLSNLAQIQSNGSLEPDTLKSDIHYDLDIKELAFFKPITQSPIRGPFATSGKVTGDKKLMRVQGTSNIANSDTSYNLSLKAMQPHQLKVTMANARLEKLIYMAGQPALAKGLLNIGINLDKLDPEDLRGKAKLAITQASFNSKTFKKEYQLKLPQTDFSSDVNVDLNGKVVSYLADFSSSLASIKSKGTLEPKTLALDASLNVAIAKLELLRAFTGAPLRGSMQLDATAKGDKKRLMVKGGAKIAEAKATFDAVLETFVPRTVHANITKMQLAKILYMVSQPHFADAVLDVKVDIPDARVGHLDGSITTAITKGQLDTKVLEKSFEFQKMPTTSFNAKTVSLLRKELIDTQVTFDSTLASLKVKRARFNVTNGSLHADYVTQIPNLDNLFFVTERHLKGSATINGALSKAKALDFDAHTKLFGGHIDAKLHNDDFHADMTQLNTLGMLQMLIYPEIFDATLNGKLDYNLAKKIGQMDAKLTKGHFTKNQMLDLIKQYAKIDLYSETFLSTVHSNIKQEHIRTNLDMRSNKSSIVGKQIYLNTKTKQLDAKLDVNANNNPIKVHLSGNVSKPNVKVDASKLIERELKKEAGKQLNHLIKGLF